MKPSVANFVRPFTKREFSKLPIQTKLVRQRSWPVVNIAGSLMEGLARLNEPDFKDVEEKNVEEITTVNGSTVENVTNSEVRNASTTGGKQFFYIATK